MGGVIWAQNLVISRETVSVFMCVSSNVEQFSDCTMIIIITRKRAIAKALHLEGHSDFAPVDLAYYQHFLSFCSKILRF